jgi:beta-galactosidase
MTFPDRVISGAMHYFRTPPELWADRLARLAAMGLNTVETYVAWNFHAPGPGAADFGGWRDLPRFVSLAAAAGLDVIVRPGPYICAEWDFGGLPAWLLRSRAAGGPGVTRLRCLDDRYLAAVDDWFDELLPRVVPLLASRGGPVVAVQVENEYGSYGSDSGYLSWLRDGLIRRGVDVPLFTSDAPGPDYLASGTLPGTLATVNFGSRSASAFAALREFRPDSPLFCMEFWNGWFDHWGEKHHVRDPAEAAAELDAMLAAGASVNLYMAHGGTNFGLWSGANWDPAAGGAGLLPTVTSYDYDAPVGEAGELTTKFWAFREVIAKYAPVPDVPASLTSPPPRLRAQSLPVRGRVPLLDSVEAFGPGTRSPLPLPMEDAGSGRGLILYRGSVLVPPDGRDLILDGLADRAIVFADDRRIADFADGSVSGAAGVPLSPRADGEPTRIAVLAENRGRVNFAHRLGDRKGVTGIRLADRFIHDWESMPVELDAPGFTSTIEFGPAAPAADPDASGGIPGAPVFAAFAADIEAPADGFLALPGWGRGFAWLNGFLLGRYDAVGPQGTLYAPAPLWRPGPNELVVLELDQAGGHLEIRDQPDLGEPG